MIQVIRLGFHHSPDPKDGPERALTTVLREMVEHGHRILSVSVLVSPRHGEAYECFVVSDYVEEPPFQPDM